MEKRTDKNSYTILFAIAMVVIVGTVLAFAAESLKPKITENKRLEIQQNILYAMGVNENDESSVNFIPTDKVAVEFSKYIKEQLVIQIENGKVRALNRQEYMAANIGITPQNDGIQIRLFTPPLTEERRKELFKKAKMSHV